MPHGIPHEHPTVKCTIRIYLEDLEKLKRFYPSGYNLPLILLIHRHVRDLENHRGKEMERMGFSSDEIEAVS